MGTQKNRFTRPSRGTMNRQSTYLNYELRVSRRSANLEIALLLAKIIEYELISQAR